MRIIDPRLPEVFMLFSNRQEVRERAGRGEQPDVIHRWTTCTQVSLGLIGEIAVCCLSVLFLLIHLHTIWCVPKRRSSERECLVHSGWLVCWLRPNFCLVSRVSSKSERDDGDSSDTRRKKKIAPAILTQNTCGCIACWLIEAAVRGEIAVMDFCLYGNWMLVQNCEQRREKQLFYTVRNQQRNLMWCSCCHLLCYLETSGWRVVTSDVCP